MPMRKTRVRERRPRIEPTSRPSDVVCLLFSRPNCDAASSFVQAYLPTFQVPEMRLAFHPHAQRIASDHCRAGQCCSVSSWIQTALSNSRNAVSFSSACTTIRFLSPRCLSVIQIIRPLESIAETHPQLQPALLAP